MIEFEKGKSNFEKLLNDASINFSNKNEAETRIKIIDRIFLECLGWSRDELVVEESYNNTFTDYIFSSPYKSLIVEAKKEGEYFEVPEGSKCVYSIKSLIQNNTNLKKAIEQVTGYCKDRGIEFAVVFNGHQLLAFIGNRVDGNPPLEGKTYLFSSLEKIKDNFTLFWNILSKESIENRNLLKKLTTDEQKLEFNKLSKLIPFYPGSKIRNELQADLDNLSGIVFEDIAKIEENKQEFLKECYCSSGALSNYSLLSKEIIESRYSQMFDSQNEGPYIKPANTKKGIDKELFSSFNKRPILLIGDVGVGKTSFIENLIYIEAPEIFNKSFTLYLDFGSDAALALDLKQFILNEIIAQFENNYKINFNDRNFVRSVYDSDIKKFGNSIYSDLKDVAPEKFKEKELLMLEEKISDKFNHLKESVLHIQKSWKKQLILFLDNTDQRSESTQQEVFIIAQELTLKWNSTVFLPMRPETFNRSNQLGHLSGYNSKAFTISPPRTEQVIEKRINYAIKLASGEEQIQCVESYIQSVKLSNFLNIFKYSFNKTRDLKDFIVNISGGNIRWALDYVKNFFGSGHIDTTKILNIYEEQGYYDIPLHEFLKTVMYKNNEFYNSDEFPITNIFEVFGEDKREHFLTSLIIYFLYTNSENKTEGGYTSHTHLINNLQAEGFTEQQIENHLRKCLKRKLIEASSKRIPDSIKDMPMQLRPTSIGLYHLLKLPASFTYMEGISLDTAIFDKITYEKMKEYDLKTFANIDIMDRLSRTNYFRTYLNKIWETANFKINYNWKIISETLVVEMSKIRNKNKRIETIEIVEIVEDA